ncbi:unnamed protein product [Prorocentrum cordatum]|uniref:Uncharacterized protein n=1 Tax=Prorocentrum cordatum TaxID=2364126 RepID=A0ABN9QYT4_9DINO|nr:unnamed protein product [Polarella glacialis]
MRVEGQARLGATAARREARRRRLMACEAGLRRALGDRGGAGPGSWRDREAASRPAVRTAAAGRRVCGSSRLRRNVARHAAQPPACGFARASRAALTLAATGPRLAASGGGASGPVCEELEVQRQGAGGDADRELQPTAEVWQPLAARPFQQLQPHAPGPMPQGSGSCATRSSKAARWHPGRAWKLDGGWRLAAFAREGSGWVQSSAEDDVFVDPPASPPGPGLDRSVTHRVQEDCDRMDFEVVGVVRDAEGIGFGEEETTRQTMTLRSCKRGRSTNRKKPRASW